MQTEPFAKSALGKPATAGRPVRNALVQTEPFAKNALGKPATASKPVRSALRFVVDAPVAARFLVLQN